MKRGHSSPSSNDNAVPDTAPMAKVTAVSFAQTCASRRASSSWPWIHRHSATSISSGIATPIAAKIMWKPSESSICIRAAVSGDIDAQSIQLWDCPRTRENARIPPGSWRMALIGRGSPFLVGGALTLLAALVLRAEPAQTPTADASAAPVDFARDVQPLLEKHCYECHGTKKVKGRLRLHHPAFIAKGGESGPVIVAGDPEHSLLMRRVLGLDGDDRMPLDEDPQSDAELATLRGWIAAGAVMPAGPAQTTAADVAEHWAYVK